MFILGHLQIRKMTKNFECGEFSIRMLSLVKKSHFSVCILQKNPQKTKPNPRKERLFRSVGVFWSSAASISLMLELIFELCRKLLVRQVSVKKLM